MTELLTLMRQRAEEAEHTATRLREMVTLAEKLGDDGIAEFVAIVAANNNTTGGNGNGHGQNGDETIPRGREAVRLIVRERPGIWTLAALRTEMKQRGWFTSSKGLEVAASRLVMDGEAKRIGRGKYLFSAENDRIGDMEVRRESDPSGGALIPFDTT